MELKASFFNTGELRLHVVGGPPSGPPLVLLHGATGSLETWMDLMPRFTEQWQVFALDLRGHGRSGWAMDVSGYHILRFVEDVLAFLRKEVPEPAVVLGHSWGAVTAMLAGAGGKDCLRALVLEDPPLSLRRETTENQSFMDYFGWIWQMRQDAHSVEEVLAAIKEHYPQESPEMLQPWAQTLTWLDPVFPQALIQGNSTVVGVDFAEHARQIACPVLVLQADPQYGAALLPQDADFFMAHAPDARLVYFPGTGHGIHRNEPARLLDVFDEFMASLGLPGP